MSYNDWNILDSVNDTEELPYAPSEMWILNCFYFILQDDKGYFLPLVYPTYKYDNREQIVMKGIWSPPYNAIKIEASTERIVSAKIIRERYKKFIAERKEKINEAFDYFFYHLGVQQRTVSEPFLEFIEYKRSFGQSDRYKCYFVRNFYVTDIDNLGKINLMDPDSLRGIYYFKLNNDVDNMHFDENKNFLYYQGRPLATNLSYIIKEKKLNISQYANQIDSKKAIYNEEGYIFMYDLNSSGGLRQHIEDNFISFYHSGFELAEEFLSMVSGIFTDVFASYNITQYMLEGDGFIASIPTGKGHISFGNSVSIIREVCEEINRRINLLLVKSGKSISAKVTICEGSYQFGKIGGLTSVYNSYSGKILFSLARLQSALSSYIKSKEQNYGLYFTFNDDNIVNQSDFVKLDTYSSQEKESHLDIIVYTNKLDEFYVDNYLNQSIPAEIQPERYVLSLNLFTVFAKEQKIFLRLYNMEPLHSNKWFPFYCTIDGDISCAPDFASAKSKLIEICDHITVEERKKKLRKEIEECFAARDLNNIEQWPELRKATLKYSLTTNKWSIYLIDFYYLSNCDINSLFFSNRLEFIDIPLSDNELSEIAYNKKYSGKRIIGNVLDIISKDEFTNKLRKIALEVKNSDR